MALLVAMALMLALIVASAAYAAVDVGTNGPDTLIGTDRPDTIYGLNGADGISGKQGDDELYAGKGDDEASGNKNEDYLVGGRGFDNLFGNRGDDVIEAADNRHDLVDCGNGDADRASVDEEDTVRNCEIVNGA
jgi:Ca2+-binding RTX toxin-like protein